MHALLEKEASAESQDSPLITLLISSRVYYALVFLLLLKKLFATLQLPSDCRTPLHTLSSSFFPFCWMPTKVSSYVLRSTFCVSSTSVVYSSSLCVGVLIPVSIWSVNLSENFKWNDAGSFIPSCNPLPGYPLRLNLAHYGTCFSPSFRFTPFSFFFLSVSFFIGLSPNLLPSFHNGVALHCLLWITVKVMNYMHLRSSEAALK